MDRSANVLIALCLGLSVSNLLAGDQRDPGERYLRMAAEPGITPRQKAAYYQLSLLHTAQFPSAVPGGPIIGPGFVETCVFYAMRIDSLPVLVNALDDTTPTKTTSRSGFSGDKPHTWKVNELVGLIICGVAQREFVVDGATLSFIRGHPDLVPQFKKAVLDWYNKYHHMPIEQWKIDDISSTYHLNRSRAIEWLGEHKEKSGQQPILARVATLLATRNDDIMANWELAYCALALGQLGDRAAALESVRRICQRFSANQWEDSFPWRSDFFKVYHGLALLGEKDEALRELQRVYDAHYTDKPASDQQQFKEELAAAEKW